MSESIQIFFEPLGQIPGTGTTWYHETLVYTNSSGQRFIATCAPTANGPTVLSSQLSQLSSGASGSSTDWGTLACTSGSLADTTVSDALGYLVNPSFQTETVASGADLSSQWAAIEEAEQQITNENLNYSPLTLNSNSAADTALTAAGITVPQDLGLRGPHWAPAWGNILPTTMTQTSDNQTVSSTTDINGNPVVTVAENNPGNTADSIQINATTQTVNIEAFTSGNLQFDETTSTAANGTENASVTGTGANLTLINAAINIANGASATVNEGGNSITESANAQVTITGTNGSADNVNASSAQITLDDNSQAWANGNGDQVNLGTGDSLQAFGGGNTIYSGADDLAMIGNTNNSYDAVYANKDAFGGATANGQSTGVYVNNNAQANVYGNGNGINLGTGDAVYVYGSHDTIYANASDTLHIIGTNDVISGANIAVTYDGYNFDTGSSGGYIDYTGSSFVGYSVSFSGGYGGYGYGYGLAGNQAVIKAALGKNIGPISRQDFATGDFAAANAAEAGLHEAEAMASMAPQAPGAGSAVLEGAKWDSKIITWSLADNPGSSASPFSSYMNGSDEAAVQQAFASWGAAAGITFEEVPDSSKSDIRIGWGDFDTTNSGIVGFTSLRDYEEKIEPGVIVRLEDPSQDALTTSSTGQQVYSGTDASLSQTLLHEIGHALGLACDADPNSIMCYELTSNNQTLDATDIAGIQSLYEPGQSAGADVSGNGLNQLIQAMAGFGSGPSGQTHELAPQESFLQTPVLAVNNHH